METGAHPLSRARAFALTADAFRRLAVANAVMLVVIVATGATVRLTGSGLGCEHWPGCAPGAFIPKKGYHSDVEFSNRVVAALTVLTTLVFALVASFRPGVRTRAKLLAWAVFAGTLMQAPLGAI